ncbi:MAG: hypothetical protein EZS28_005565 [Streblomastix strix]|uniref:Uncharacterized protein n=1 Tax=Streblomastix strix TaxID=222440 RepID=A0A5J4WV22_9EUKA|nr:MAG: hypothetical protein EZS28_005565 [Streblomastix strix]
MYKYLDKCEKEKISAHEHDYLKDKQTPFSYSIRFIPPKDNNQIADSTNANNLVTILIHRCSFPIHYTHKTMIDYYCEQTNSKYGSSIPIPLDIHPSIAPFDFVSQLDGNMTSDELDDHWEKQTDDSGGRKRKTSPSYSSSQSPNSLNSKIKNVKQSNIVTSSKRSISPNLQKYSSKITNSKFSSNSLLEQLYQTAGFMLVGLHKDQADGIQVGLFIWDVVCVACILHKDLLPIARRCIQLLQKCTSSL